MSVIDVALPQEQKKEEGQKKSKVKIGIRGHLKLLIGGLTVGHIAGFAVIGLYYLLTQEYHPFKVFWDHLFDKYIPILSAHNWKFYRHLIFRDAAEGFYASNLWQQLSFNPYKYRESTRDKVPNRFDRLMISLHIPNKWQEVCTGRSISGLQLSVSWLVEAVFGIPGAVLGVGLVLLARWVTHGHHLGAVAQQHPSFVQKVYTDAWDAKVVGFLAGYIFAKYVMKPVYFHVFDYFAERRVARRGKLHFWHMPYYKRWVQDLRMYHGSSKVRFNAVQAQANRGQWVPAMMRLFVVGIIGFSVFGYYVVQNYVK